MATEPVLIEVRGALAGDPEALRHLVQGLTPVIQARVARVLLRSVVATTGRNVRQEVEDLTQEVFLTLFDNESRVLASWQPERGLSLANFVGLVAERQAISILRSGKRSPWKEDPTFADELDEPDPARGPEEVAASRQELGQLLDRLREALSPLGWQLFELLFVEELPLPAVAERTGLSADAIYAWRSRLRKLAQRLAGETSETAGSARRPSMGGGR
ncbi:MAG TPA: sigma-70 family RNA polymerase sigma factor [Thermoanaerobaculia bacterium]|nr:sigma-70 family RNA polymerase sigma factor [Thermoanaerobaculia bacterium]